MTSSIIDSASVRLASYRASTTALEAFSSSSEMEMEPRLEVIVRTPSSSLYGAEGEASYGRASLLHGRQLMKSESLSAGESSRCDEISEYAPYGASSRANFFLSNSHATLNDIYL